METEYTHGFTSMQCITRRYGCSVCVCAPGQAMLLMSLYLPFLWLHLSRRTYRASRYHTSSVSLPASLYEEGAPEM